ncbi:uncharacterized protein C8Q71DRAFT_743480 [Rhodofomes roseus]|uniref:Uncharacterized protein n=1 Tax=Rhodofomes roseus TaxID=34475 RepID=A0ABQ8KRS8_9APHY|nr:uncharacterized protein C8Q71DRAFT_743480 [Rhodofomes roseus]KAH9841107.1 hypothetical protein C8Q71DRAFT_743480 [Rhodofomes roseus]
MPPSTTRDATMQSHMRKMRRILAQIDQHGPEHGLYEAVNEILLQVARMIESPDYDVSVHPQALLLIKPETEGESNDSASDTSSISYASSTSEKSAASDSDVASDEGSVSETQSGDADESDGSASAASIKTVKPSTSNTHAQSSNGKGKKRFPDFVTHLSFHLAHRRILFVHEVKRLPQGLTFTLGPRPTLRNNPEVFSAFTQDITQAQILQQVQFAFERYPLENQIRAMCIIGLFFEVLVFERDRTPQFDEYRDGEATSVYTSVVGPHHIFNERFTGYNSVFKAEWKKAADVKLKAINNLTKGERGPVAAEPFMQYDFDSEN